MYEGRRTAALLHTAEDSLSEAGGIANRRGGESLVQKFHSGIAEAYGVTAALLAERIWREVKENEFHQRCVYVGNVWMRCSRRGFTVCMPYLTKGMVSGEIRKLKRAGILVQGEHNNSRFDRTAWYAFTEYGKKMMEESEDEDYAG